MARLSNAQLKGLLEQHRLLAAVAIDDPAMALPLGQAFMDGGLPFIEITYRSEHASSAIRMLSEVFPALAVGAGTILSLAQAEAALTAGASFLVAPGFDAELVKFAKSQGVAFMPGVQTATEVSQAIKSGITLAKFFPATAAGGLDALKALAGPFPNMRFMPTGGIDQTNMTAFLKEANVVACGGSWLAPKALMAAGDFAKIRNIIENSVHLARQGQP